MSKILTADEISAALEGAKDEKALKAAHKQIILSVTEQEAAHTENLELIAKLNADLEVAKNALNEKEEALAKSEESLGKANQTIEELGSQLALKASQKGNAVIVSHNKKQFEIIGDNFFTRKGKLNALELSKDKELIAEMIEKQSGAIVEVTK